jgi:hypothetical protein
MIILDNEISKIKNDRAEYIFQSELGFLFMWIILALMEVYFYNFNFVIKALTYTLVITSVYKVLSILIYNNTPIIQNKLKFIDKSVKVYLMKKEEALYVTVQVKLIIVFLIFMAMVDTLIPNETVELQYICKKSWQIIPDIKVYQTQNINRILKDNIYETIKEISFIE